MAAQADPNIYAEVAVTLDGVAFEEEGGFFKNLRTTQTFEYDTNSNGEAVVNIGQGFQVGDIFEHQPPGTLIIIYSCMLIARYEWLISQGFEMTVQLKSPKVATDDDQQNIGTINTLNFEPRDWSPKNLGTKTFDNEKVLGKAADMSVKIGMDSQCDEYPGTVTKDDKVLLQGEDYMGYDYIVMVVTQVKLSTENGDLEIGDTTITSANHIFKGPEPPNQGNGGVWDPPDEVAFDTDDLETIDTDYAKQETDGQMGWHTHMKLKIHLHYGYYIENKVGEEYVFWAEDEYDYDTVILNIVWDWVT